MTTPYPRGAAIAVALLAALPRLAFAHGGEDHGTPVPPPPVAVANFAGEGTGFQAVLVPGADGATLVYLADADTNAPIADANIEVEAAGWRGAVTPDKEAGVYRLAWTPPQGGADVVVTVLAGGRDDLLLIPAVKRPAETDAAPVPLQARAVAVEWRGWAGGIVIGMGLGLLVAGLTRRARPAVAALVVGLIWALGMTDLGGGAWAHEGHDHGAAPESPATRPGAPVAMSKATQFLLAIRTARVEAREVGERVRVVGRVIPDPAGFARVQPSQPARVLADTAFPLPVPGQPVTRGQVIAVLEPTLTTLELSDRRAALARVEGEIAMQEREAQRQGALKGLVAPKLVEDTRSRLDQLRREKTQIADTALARELVTAPIDGVVTDVHIVPGEVVTSDKAMIEIVDPARARVEAVLFDLGLADHVTTATAASPLLPGLAVPLRLLGVSPRIDARDQGLHVLFTEMDGQAGRLRIGMAVDVFVATGTTRRTIAIPREAVTEAGGRSVVFVRVDPETFEARPVRVARVVGPWAEIAGGLAAGERVVVEGVEQLRAGR